MKTPFNRKYLDQLGHLVKCTLNRNRGLVHTSAASRLGGKYHIAVASLNNKNQFTHWVYQFDTQKGHVVSARRGGFPNNLSVEFDYQYGAYRVRDVTCPAAHSAR